DEEESCIKLQNATSNKLKTDISSVEIILSEDIINANTCDKRVSNESIKSSSLASPVNYVNDSSVDRLNENNQERCDSINNENQNTCNMVEESGEIVQFGDVVLLSRVEKKSCLAFGKSEVLVDKAEKAADANFTFS